MFVYLIRNLTNGKCYVGKTTRSVAARWRQHKTEMRIGRIDSDLYRDMRALGVAAFSVEVLGECGSQRRLAQMERTFIRSLNTVAEGYNKEVASFGGRIRRSARTRSCSSLAEDHRKKIADSVRIAWLERKAVSSADGQQPEMAIRKIPPGRVTSNGVAYAAA